MSYCNGHTDYKSVDPCQTRQVRTTPDDFRYIWENLDVNNGGLKGWTRVDDYAVPISMIKADLIPSKAGKLIGYMGGKNFRNYVSSMTFRLLRLNQNVYKIVLQGIEAGVLNKSTAFHDILRIDNKHPRTVRSIGARIIAGAICIDAIKAYGTVPLAAKAMGVTTTLVQFWLERMPKMVPSTWPKDLKRNEGWFHE